VSQPYGEALGQFLRVGPAAPSGQARHWRRAAPLAHDAQNVFPVRLVQQDLAQLSLSRFAR
jgi:hypothetical protein